MKMTLSLFQDMGFAGNPGHFPVGRLTPGGHADASAADAWWHHGMGRTGEAALPWGASNQGSLPSFNRHTSNQPDLQKSGL